MKWIYRIRQKMQVALLLGIIVLVVCANNVMESKNVTELGGSFSSVYEDRLLVESYIYKLSEHLYLIPEKIMLDHCRTTNEADLRVKIDLHNTEIRNLIHHYENTKLTEKESRVFGELKRNIGWMAALENDYMDEGIDRAGNQARLGEQFLIAASSLGDLSLIQIKEAKNLNDDSKKIIADFTMLTRFELAMLIAIGLIIQALILSSTPILPEKMASSNLN